MNTRDVAAAVGTEPKTLRAFLRQSEDYHNAGSGGRYSFTKKQLKKLTERFEEWANAKPSAKRKKMDPAPDGPGLSVSVVGSSQRGDRDLVAQLSHERVDRLEAALLARGLHISQLKDRDTFRRVSA